MQPRPRIPMQGGMGPQMMGRSPFGGGNPMMGPGSNPFGGRNPLMGQMMGRPQQMSRGGGGLLSKILGRGNQAAGVRGLGGIQGAGRAATGGGGGLLQSLSNPSGISSMLNNTQQVLKTAQSFGPMIQQYGPIVKNLPAMWKLYRGLKNAPDSTEEASTESKKTSKETEKKVEINSNENESAKGKHKVKKETTSSKETPPVRRGSSLPKLYI